MNSKIDEDVVKVRGSKDIDEDTAEYVMEIMNDFDADKIFKI